MKKLYLLLLALCGSEQPCCALSSLSSSIPASTRTSICKKYSTDMQCYETYDPFKTLIGIDEEQFFKKMGHSPKGVDFLKTKLQGKQGTFYVKQVEPFKNSLNAIPKQSSLIFSIVEGGELPTGTWFQSFLDVSALQAHPINNNAVFQVASNLSCLESGGTKQERISYYYCARAQGQLCAVSALPGTIDRMYIHPSINLLQYFNWHGPIAYSSGKFPSVTDITTRFKNMTHQDILKAAETMCVGIQKNVRVTSGSRDFSKNTFTAIRVKDYAQNITQVFTAALDPYNNDSSTVGFENLARILLHGAYKGTFDATREVGANKLFLTMVGGGVFQNKYEWIAQAIQTACLDFPHQATSRCPLEVTLVLYHIPATDKKEKDWQMAEKIFKQLVSNTKGTWTRYAQPGTSMVDCS